MSEIVNVNGHRFVDLELAGLGNCKFYSCSDCGIECTVINNDFDDAAYFISGTCSSPGEGTCEQFRIKNLIT